MLRLYTITVLVGALIITTPLLGQWDVEAGLNYVDIESLSASSATSTDAATLTRVSDNDPNTQWISKKPLPYGYVSNPDQNILKNYNETLVSSSGSTDASMLTDGVFWAMTTVQANNGKAWLDIQLPTNQAVLVLHTKIRTSSDVSIYAHTTSQDSILIGVYSASDSYSWKRYDFNQSSVQRISYHSDATFYVFETAALADYPKEYVVVDLGAVQEVNKIVTRHWAGWNTATGTELKISNDNVNWTFVANLSPGELKSVTTSLPSGTQARYIMVEHTLKLQDWSMVYVWEIDAKVMSSDYGDMPAHRRSYVTLGDMLGVNTVWGWGHNMYTDLLQPGEGPELHNSHARFVRYYHNMNWDVFDPDNQVDYDAMVNGAGTEVHWWLDWTREYNASGEAGLEIMTSIKIGTFADHQWDNPYQSAYNYGYAYARAFGPTYGNGFTKYVEVGNEPWSYDSNIYREILRGMASGLKSGDPALKVLPCALQAFDPSAEQSSSKHFIGTKVTPSEAAYLDGLNVHAYSWDQSGAGIKPEDDQSTFRGIVNMIRFRDANMPGKPIYLTEWGWDTAGAGEDCTHGQCVSERAGAVYAVRGALMALRLGVYKAAWYFSHNVNDFSGLFSRSGLTGSPQTGFAKKQAFYAFEAVTNQLGNAYFLDVIQEDNNAWVYLMGDAAGNPTHIVAWRPIDGDDTSTRNITIEGYYSVNSAVKIEGLSSTGESTNLPTISGNQMTITISAIPTVITLGSISELTSNNDDDFEINQVDEKSGRIVGPVEQIEETNTFSASQHDVEENFSLTVYPNPTSDVINVSFDSAVEINTQRQVEIINANGKILSQNIVQDRTIQYSASALNLTSGTYYIRVSNNRHGSSITKPFIVNL